MSATRSAEVGNDLVALVGADLELTSLSQVLADLPIGDGARAYVLAPSGAIVAAPPEALELLQETVDAEGRVLTADDLGLTTPADDLGAGETRYDVQGDRIFLTRAFEADEDLDWILEIEADEGDLSPGLDRLTATVVAITLFSLVIAIGALLLALRVWRPLRAMRDRAATDQLTGLANRHELLRRGSALVEKAAARGDRVLAVAFDLDNFKLLNDTYGHEAGDHALETVALALRENVRAGDLAARTGGDEFVAVLVLRRNDEPFDVVARMRDHIEHALNTRVFGGEEVGVTAGYATTVSEDGLDGLMGRADDALVAGKREGKGRVYGA
ncbi:diguanylate cyclase [Demequina sp. NBRC 110056]|uniref:GGDEF domain-containing protein n=1 Tax=Demequina sp. NBRC 110056 TaxID=1570345 RepID=UPI000A075D7A|nr:diguanylate cyclase [Demequina sp. NBRC 110056]